jgi:aldose 1-epimerase
VKWAVLLLAVPAAASAQPADDAVVLHNRSGMEVHIIPHGATITRVIVPDRLGHRANVVLGYATAAEYREKNRKNMFGATIGRYAGRIAGARFMLDGKPVQLVANDGRNALHGGGKAGLDNIEWTPSRAEAATRRASARPPRTSSRASPAGSRSRSLTG